MISFCINELKPTTKADVNPEPTHLISLINKLFLIWSVPLRVVRSCLKSRISRANALYLSRNLDASALDVNPITKEKNAILLRWDDDDDASKQAHRSRMQRYAQS